MVALQARLARLQIAIRSATIRKIYMQGMLSSNDDNLTAMHEGPSAMLEDCRTLRRPRLDWPINAWQEQIGCKRHLRPRASSVGQVGQDCLPGFSAQDEDLVRIGRASDNRMTSRLMSHPRTIHNGHSLLCHNASSSNANRQAARPDSNEAWMMDQQLLLEIMRMETSGLTKQPAGQVHFKTG